MFTWTDGQEFHVGDDGGWTCLTLHPGMVIEVKLEGEFAAGEEELWGGFLVYAVEVASGGELVVTAKSLGCSNSDVSKSLSSAFNRRVGVLHLCQLGMCLEEGEYTMHVQRLRTFSVEGFQRSYITASGQRQLKKWLEELGGTEGSGLPAPLEHPLGPVREAPGGSIDGTPLSPGDEEALPREKKRTPAGAPPRAELRVSQSERDSLRRRLDAAKEKMVGERRLGGAGKRAGHPTESRQIIDISSSEGYSASEPEALVKMEPVKRKRKQHRPLDPLGPSRALAALQADLPVPGSPKKKKKKAARDVPDETTAVATRGSTTTSCQKQLMARAAESAQERKDKRSDQRHGRKPEERLARILTKVVQGKKDTKKKKKKKDRQRKKKGMEGGGPSGSSDGSPTGSSDGSSGSDSEGADSSSSDPKKMEPPLKRKAMQRPGSVLRMLVEHAMEKLDQTSKIAVSRKDEDDLTQGVRITTYFAIVVKPQLNQMSPQLRELHMLAHGLDLLRAGELDSLGDLLASRFISLHQAGIDGNWHAARHLELIPYDESSAAGAAVVLQARKHARLAAQVAGQEPRSWKGSGRGRGRGSGWEDSGWGQDHRGKGKKGDKGKGRGKMGGKGQQAADTAGDGRTKEKLPEK